MIFKDEPDIPQGHDPPPSKYRASGALVGPSLCEIGRNVNPSPLYIYVCVVCICMCVCIYAHIYVYIHTHIYINKP